MPQKLNQFFLELKNRRLLQTGAWYVAVAWGGIEILAFLTDSLLGRSAADDARRYLAILLIAGFPAAMYLAWTRDLGTKARRFLSAGVVAVLVAAVVVYLIPDDSTIPALDNSVAVLPFDVCEERSSDKPLASGLTAAVHGRLSDRNSIHVKGWRSVRSVIETSPSIPVMASLLGVKYFLSGIVCRDARAPTLAVELLNDQGTVVWQNKYKQDSNAYGQVEVQLADLVDKGVSRKFGDVSTRTATEAVDREALIQLRVGHGYLEEGDAEQARVAFERALEIQPGYSEAVYGLARVAVRGWTQDDEGPKKQAAFTIAEKALETARVALQRDPRDFDANLFAGDLLHILGDWGSQLAYRKLNSEGEEVVTAYREQSNARYAEAQQYLDAALAVRPDDPEARLLASHNMDSLGVEMRRATIEIRKQGLNSDPFNMPIAAFLAIRMVEFGDVRGAMDVLDSFDKLPQGKRDIWSNQLEILNNLSRLDEQLAYYIEMVRADPSPGFGNHILQIWRTTGRIAHLGLYEEAEELYHQVADVHVEDSWVRDRFLVNPYLHLTGHVDQVTENILDEIEGLTTEEILEAWYVKSEEYAYAFWDAGERERAVELMEALAQYRSNPSRWAERQMAYPIILADWYIAVGRKDDALSVLDYIVANLEGEVLAGVRHPRTLSILAEAYALQANNEAALRTLAMAVDYGAWDMQLCCDDYWNEDVREQWGTYEDEDAWWAGLTGTPEFELIRTRMRSIVDAQRASIRVLLEQNDLGELLEPWKVPREEAVAEGG